MGSPSFSFSCSGCGKRLSTPVSLVGRSAKCYKCGHRFVVPAPEAVATASTLSAPNAAPPLGHSGAVTNPVAKPSPPSLAGPSQQGMNQLPSNGGKPIIPKSRPISPHGLRAIRWGAIGAIAVIVLGVGGTILARGRASKMYGQAARAAAKVIPAAAAVAPTKVIRQEEVDAILNGVRINEIRSNNVYQQMVSYARGSMEMSELVALGLGASKDDAANGRRAADLAEIGTRTVHQQKAVYLEGMMQLLASGARASGASATEVESIRSQVRTNDIGTDTVHQQCANYCNGCLHFAEIIVRAEGGSSTEATAIMSEARLAEIRADTVHQQIVGRLTAFVKMLALAAQARGASAVVVDGVLSEMRLADISADTVFQQEVTRLSAALKLLGLIATGG